MLYVDARSCVDCGACVTACPVDAIQPHTSLTPQQQPFVALNAEYYDALPAPRPHAAGPGAAASAGSRRRGPFRVAVVGAGPAGLYAADELLRHPEVHGRRVRPAADAVRAGARGRRARPPGHQAGDDAVRGDRARARVRLPARRRGRPRRHPRRAACALRRRRVRRRRGDRPAARDPGGGPARLASPPPTSSAGTTATPTSRSCACRSHHERVGGGRQRQRRARRGPDPHDRPRRPRHAPTSPPCPGRRCAAAGCARWWCSAAAVPPTRRSPCPSWSGWPAIEDLNVVVDTGGEPIDGDTAKLRLLAELAARPRVEGRRTLVLRFRTTPDRILGNDAGHRRRGRPRRRDRGDRVRAGAPGDRLPRRAGRGPAVRRRHRHRPERPRPGAPRRVRRRLGQARPHRLHRHQQVVRAGDRRADARRRRRGCAPRTHAHPRRPRRHCWSRAA